MCQCANCFQFDLNATESYRVGHKHTFSKSALDYRKNGIHRMWRKLAQGTMLKINILEDNKRWECGDQNRDYKYWDCGW